MPNLKRADYERELAEAYDRGYVDGDAEARASLLIKFAHWFKKGDTKKTMEAKIARYTQKLKDAGRWPEGF